jgi:hypothetical protein
MGQPDVGVLAIKLWGDFPGKEEGLIGGGFEFFVLPSFPA